MNDIEKIKAALALARRFAKAPEVKDEYRKLADADWCIIDLSPLGRHLQIMNDIEKIKAALTRARHIVPTGKKQIDEAIAAAKRLTFIA